MTTLVEIPSCTALHLPTPTSEPLPLSTGDLVLTLLPAAPPSRPSPTLTLTIGASSFPLLPNTPLQKVKAQEEHPSYVFSPAPADGGAPIGRVKIIMKGSSNPGEWQATESLCAKFEEVLNTHGVWNERILFVNDEYEASAGGPAPSWGESLAASVIGAGQVLANKLNLYTDNQVAHTDPRHPPPPSRDVATAATDVKTSTATLASYAGAGAVKIGQVIHESGVKVGTMLPDYIAKPAEPVADHEKTEMRKGAESVWEQVTVAAKGVAQAATTVGSALSENAHRAVEHNFGKEADGVAQDIGQSGANLGSTALSVGEGTSVFVQGYNAGTGVVSGAATVKPQ